MRRSLLVGVFVALLFGGGAVSAVAQDHEEAVDAATTAAQDWLALLDKDEYEATWNAASSYFRSSLTADEWTDRITSAHRNLSSMESRSQMDAQFKTSVPNAPDGQYVIIEYETTYDEKKTIETVTVQKDGDTWAVAGYSVSPAPAGG